MKYMNKLTLGIVLAAGLFTACSDKDDVDIPGGLALDKKEIAIGPQGGTEQIAIAASQDWVANTSEPWLMLSPANGVGSVEGTIKVDSTLSNTLRSTELSFQGANGQSRKLTITQFGYGKQIFLKDSVVEIENSDSYDNRAFESLISANVECKIGKIEYSFEGDLTDAEKDIVLHGPMEKRHILYVPKNKDHATELDFTYYNAVYTVENALAKARHAAGAAAAGL